MRKLDLDTLERIGKAMSRFAELTRERDEALALIREFWPDFALGAESAAAVTVAAEPTPQEPKRPVPGSHVAMAMIRKHGPMTPAEVIAQARAEHPNLDQLTSVKSIRAAMFRQKVWFDHQADGKYALTADALKDDELIAPFGGAKP